MWVLLLFQLWMLVPHCPPGMVDMGGFCIDQYEAPNEKGARPLIMQSFPDAERWCSEKGRRVCAEEEWTEACRRQGKHRVCNNRADWWPFDIDLYADPKTRFAEVERLYQGSLAGTYPTCRTPEGVFDLDGNVEEWVVARKGRPHKAVLTGGFWAKSWPRCGEVNDAHEPTFRFYETGFRCCKDTGL